MKKCQRKGYMVLMNNFEIQLLNLILNIISFGATIYYAIYVYKKEKDEKSIFSQKEIAIILNVMMFALIIFTIVRLIKGI